jgi:hypothetical protein
LYTLTVPGGPPPPPATTSDVAVFQSRAVTGERSAPAMVLTVHALSMRSTECKPAVVATATVPKGLSATRRMGLRQKGRRTNEKQAACFC